MLLRLPQRPEFPIGHLLSFANFFAKQLCGNFCKANLIIKLMYFHVVTLNIYENDKEANSLFSFTMKKGEKFLIYEHDGKLCAEEKKRFYEWKTISGFNVNPHSNMKRNIKACRFCPF